MIELEHGTFRAFQRHRREKTPPCDLCKAAKRGYDQGYKNATANTVARMERATRPTLLAEAALNVCRQLVYRHPYPVVREQAVAIIRQTDAELVADEKARAA